MALFPDHINLDETTKVTIIAETRHRRLTYTLPRTSLGSFEHTNRVPPRVSPSGIGRDPYYRFSEPRLSDKAEVTLTLTALADPVTQEYMTVVDEELDPIPDEVKALIDKLTKDNINDRQRKQLTDGVLKLLEQARKESSKK